MFIYSCYLVEKLQVILILPKSYFIEHMQHTIQNAQSVVPKENHNNLRVLMGATQKGSPIKIHNRLVELVKSSDFVNNPV
jgi:hypothetical protein